MTAAGADAADVHVADGDAIVADADTVVAVVADATSDAADSVDIATVIFFGIWYVSN